MENKLQELTQKLYTEGLSKGEQEAKALVEAAKSEAQSIVAQAQKEATQVIKEAEARAEDLRKNTLTELTLAGRQSVGTLKEQIEKLVLLKSISPAVSAANNDTEFIKSLLLSIASAWNPADGSKVELRALLPAQKQEQLSALVVAGTQNTLTQGLEINFDNGVKSGFKIGPKDGSYYISFSDADFDALLKEYLRPQVSALLFGEEA